jgi:hypothetical protein
VIVRVLETGQFEVADDLRGELDAADDRLEAAFRANDQAAFTKALDALVAWLGVHGTLLDPTEIVPSDYVLPAPGSDLDEVRTLVDSEGLGV